MRPMRPVRIFFQNLREIEIGRIVPQRGMPQPIEQPDIPVGFQIPDLFVCRQIPTERIGSYQLIAERLNQRGDFILNDTLFRGLATNCGYYADYGKPNNTQQPYSQIHN